MVTSPSTAAGNASGRRENCDVVPRFQLQAPGNWSIASKIPDDDAIDGFRMALQKMLFSEEAASSKLDGPINSSWDPSIWTVKAALRVELGSVTLGSVRLARTTAQGLCPRWFAPTPAPRRNASLGYDGVKVGQLATAQAVGEIYSRCGKAVWPSRLAPEVRSFRSPGWWFVSPSF